MLHCKRSCKRNLQSGWAGPISWLLSLCCHSNISLHVKSCLPSALQEEWPLLIIVPASLRLVWAEEIERWLPHIRPGDVTVIEGKDDRSASTATTAPYLASHMHCCCCHHFVWLCFKLGPLQGCMCGGVSLHHQAIGQWLAPEGMVSHASITQCIDTAVRTLVKKPTREGVHTCAHVHDGALAAG